MQIRNYFTLGLMLVSTTSFAAGSVQMFASKSECLRHFTLSSGTSNVVAGENYCKDKVVKTAADICADKKLLDFKIKNSISSVQESQYFQKFKSECLTAQTATGAAQQTNQAAQTAERDTQVAQQQAAMAAQQQAAAEAAKAQGATAQQQQVAAAKANADVLNALLPVINKVGSDYDKANAAATKEAAQGTPASTGSSAAATPATAAAAPTAAATGSTPQAAAVTEPKTEEEARDMESSSGSGSESETVSPEAMAAVKAEAERNSASIASELKGAEKDLPGLKGELDGVGKASSAGDATPPVSEITASSQKASGELKASIEKAVGGVTQAYASNSTASMTFEMTYEAVSSAREAVQTYMSVPKNSCTSMTEKTEFLCMEGSSPGMQATKTLMSAAGPILAAVGSAQKACNNTSKVAGLAGGAVMLAKGVCMAAQMACTSTCGAANSAFQGKITALSSKAKSALQSEFNSIQSLCAFLESAVVTASQGAKCYQEINAKFAATNKALAEIQAAAKKEAAPTPGTSTGLATKCKMKAADIIAMAVNAATLFAAQQSAKECDRQLAAAGAAGGAVTPTQYCETPGNSGTQFCKCKQNANQEGCPGYAGKGMLLDKDGNKDSVAGINLKTGKGLSSFAGGSRGTAGGFGNNGKQEYNPSAPGTGEKLALTGGDAAAAGGGGYGGSAGGGGSSAGGGAGEGSGAKPEPKKWSFGSFANALGGMFGGGSGSKGAKSNGNGNLSSKQAAAIKRKLASDKLAGEITSASGKSNWEKVHQVYLIKDNTLLTGN